MKFIKTAISLPEDTLIFAKQKAKRIAKTRGARPNVSAYFSELVVADRQREEKVAKAA